MLDFLIIAALLSRSEPSNEHVNVAQSSIGCSTLTTMSTPRSYNDEPMMDAHPMNLDQYGTPDFSETTADYRQNYATRSRPTSQQYASPDQASSAAARRYSPMRLTPTPSDKSSYVSYTPNSQAPPRQSPTRPGMFQSQSYFTTPSTPCQDVLTDKSQADEPTL